MAIAAFELTWITSLLNDIGIFLKTPLILFCDNLSALYLTTNPLFQERTKHIEIDYHFVREKVANYSLVTLYVRATNQLGDIFIRHSQSLLLQ